MPRASKPKAGDTYRLTQEVLGDGPGSIYEGQVVTVRDVGPADVQGAHDDSEESVVIEWTEPGHVRGDDGKIRMGEVPRAVSIAASQFSDLFAQEG